MGWVCEADGHHEGFFVAVVPVNGWQFRELTHPGDVDQPIRIVQVACGCGWRSARFYAPPGSRWYPSIVEIPRFPPTPMFPRGQEHPIEDAAIALWKIHTLIETDKPFPHRDALVMVR